jgi:Zn-dependent peptidase ImmA (M78 family)
MSDYPVSPRSDEQVTQLAKRLRAYFGLSDVRRIDVLACARSRSIWTVNGERELRLELRSDDEMGLDDGLTIYEEKSIVIAVKRSIHYAAYMGDGRARNTFGHEFGHCVMHKGAPKSRRTLGNAKFKFVQPFESAEHQAKVFAPAFLINDETAARLGSAEEISVEFGVSLESATIYYRQLLAQRDRQRSAENVLRMAKEARAVLSPPKTTHTVTFLAEPCSICRNATIFPIGHKFMCRTCDAVFDRFQDGDTVEF